MMIHPYTQALQRQFGDTATTVAPAPSKAASAAMGAAGGALLGTLGGLVVGALAGNTGAGAAIGALGGAAVGGAVGYSKTASASTTPASSGSGTSVVLSGGEMTGIQLSVGDTAEFTAPDGPGTINLLSSDSSTVSVTGMATPAVATAKKVGSATLTAMWTDGAGKQQASSIPVTVIA